MKTDLDVKLEASHRRFLWRLCTFVTIFLILWFGAAQ